jgi:hypothetical protein
MRGEGTILHVIEKNDRQMPGQNFLKSHARNIAVIK